MDCNLWIIIARFECHGSLFRTVRSKTCPLSVATVAKLVAARVRKKLPSCTYCFMQQPLINLMDFELLYPF